MRYVERDNFDFEILNGDVSRAPPYGVNISQLIRFTIWPTNARNKSLTAKLFQQGYRYHKLKVMFFLNCNVSKYDTGLKSLLLQGLSEPEFYNDLVYKFRKNVGNPEFF